MSNRDDEILNMLSKMSDDQRDTTRAISNLDKKVDLHIQKMEYEMRGIHEEDASQNRLLAEHIAGVNTLKQIHEEHVRENNKRFAPLEAPRKALRTITKVVLWLGGIGTAVMGVIELLDRMKGH